MSRHRASTDQVGYDSDRDELITMIRALERRCTALESRVQSAAATNSTATKTTTSAATAASTISIPSDWQSPNTVFAGPGSGTASDAPKFRGLVALDVPSLDTSKLTSGTMATARLGSGAASSSNFLRGDSSWSAITNADLPVSGVSAGTYAPPTSITVNSRGIITAIS